MLTAGSSLTGFPSLDPWWGFSPFPSRSKESISFSRSDRSPSGCACVDDRGSSWESPNSARSTASFQHCRNTSARVCGGGAHRASMNSSVSHYQSPRLSESSNGSISLRVCMNSLKLRLSFVIRIL